MKRLLTTLLLLGIIYSLYTYSDYIIRFITFNVVYGNDVESYESNEYRKEDNFLFVDETTNNIVKNKQDMLNMIYTALNGGWPDVTFYCDIDYDECIDDFNYLNENYYIASVNNFVSPFNNYQDVYIIYSNIGRIHLDFSYKYNKNEIEIINNILDDIILSETNDTMSDQDKIKAVHDYIINTTKYDEEILESTNEIDREYASSAYGLLVSHKAICNAYSDTTALLLDKLNIVNYQILSDDHSWNYVKLENIWYHIDTTWDDPITNTGVDYLQHVYFLISTEELEALNVESHDYNKNIYLEAN